jgi:CubicO group peptidase (beta-lactamase class C family)
MANNKVPGLSVAVRDKNGVVYAAVFGDANNKAFDGAAPALSPATLFQAASMGKAVSALAYLKSPLAASSLNTDIRKMVAGNVVPPYAITPADLLSHGAGTTPHGFATGYSETDPLPTTWQIVLGTSPANSPAVTFDPLKTAVFQYSGGGYLLFQGWLEQASGKPLPAFVQDALFAPAGVTRSSFTQPLPSALEHDAACGRSPSLVASGRCRKTYPELTAAGLWTTPAELACMVGYVTTRHPEILPIVTSRALKTDFDSGNYPQKMGLGLFHRPANGVDESTGHFFEHSGVNEGFLSQMVFFDDGRAIVAMDNGFAANGGISGFSVRALCRELGWTCAGKSVGP